ncbi:DUF4179 domain-containing protein [Calidifontibacillus oryziterrae]|uniref:DUF4179 domain-containing protein n=1 Tax=Calidifontibacillus oryziterrae TaxID=1191699 RepID=UPI00030DD525|nr:DUF4179 domain-containing protein [Calidifontibacillus oryziterrae]
MNSEFPNFKKEIDKITVPTEKLDQIIINTLSSSKPKKSKLKITVYACSAAVIGFGLFIGSAMISPAMAKVASHLPIVGTFFNDIGDEGLQIAGQKGLTQIVEQSAKDNGITLTINEVFYDGTRLTFGYTQESLFAIGDLERPTIEVNGKDINFSSGYSGEFITPQKYKGIIDINPTEELPEHFDMRMRIDAVGLIPGKWEFKFPVKQSNEVTVIRPEIVKDTEIAQLEISSLKIGPAGTNLNVKGIADEKDSLLLYQLQFHLTDDSGDIVNPLSGSGSGETINGKEIAELEFLYAPLKEGTKKVTLVPYIIPVSEEGYEEVVVPLDNQSFPVTMDQGEVGKVVVTDVSYLKDKVVVSYEVQSDAVIDDHASSNAIMVIDENGNNLISEEKPLPERIEGNSFKQEYVTKETKGLQLKTFKFPKPITYGEIEIQIR